MIRNSYDKLKTETLINQQIYRDNVMIQFYQYFCKKYWHIFYNINESSDQSYLFKPKIAAFLSAAFLAANRCFSCCFCFFFFCFFYFIFFRINSF